MQLNPRHQCLVYDGSPSQQLPALAAALRGRLADGFRCLYMNSAPMVAGLRSCLTEIGVDVVQEVSARRIVLSSEPPVLAGGDFDVDLMLQLLEDALDQALRDGFKGLWATGDMTWEFGAEKNFAKLMAYEYRLEKIFRRRDELCGVCQYHKDTLPPEITRQALLTHQSTFVNETVSRANPHFIPSGELSDRRATDAELDDMIEALCSAHKAKILV